MPDLSMVLQLNYGLVPLVHAEKLSLT